MFYLPVMRTVGTLFSPIASLGGSVPNFLTKHIANCGFQGRGIRPLPPLDPPMCDISWTYSLFICFVDLWNQQQEYGKRLEIVHVVYTLR